MASDASLHGFGACIQHKMTTQSMALASRALLPSEKNFSQIEKVALGIIFAISKFYRFILGRHFTLQTDHKLLLTISGSNKDLATHTANRLQRWGTILLNYNFNMVEQPCRRTIKVNSQIQRTTGRHCYFLSSI